MIFKKLVESSKGLLEKFFHSNCEHPHETFDPESQQCHSLLQEKKSYIPSLIEHPNGIKASIIDEDKEVTRKSSSHTLTYHEAPHYLKHNPYILSGYRCHGLSALKCLESMFWMTNETINIWSHVLGWMLFCGLTFYDLLLLNFHASPVDKFIVGLLLGCFQICMLTSSFYHIFSCRSEKHFNCFLTYDLLGIALSLLAIYMSGIYYAFWCHRGIQKFYLTTVFILFLFSLTLQIPSLKVSSNMKMLTFVAWAAYGVVPTVHWTFVMGGWENPIVSMLLPRVITMYAICAAAFAIYITRFPECLFKGKVDLFGSSHQWWHIFIVIALYYWHNTGIKYIEYRMHHGCATDLRL
ncbi:progestin and adipoQ receptor family member 3 isoform X4 [Bemisia tabaci]|uniref:progestin and adipoQ receptor family member 3 isoform X4 n=1 Tax=Bemisia tabaci TaxID=7038 RepID=UPI0008F9C5A4|nr:PREDICTED: progestin and adipoQ receptor family member 3-like isoform X3 [Bemisia tabaci]